MKPCETCGHAKQWHVWRKKIINDKGERVVIRASDLGFPCTHKNCDCKAYKYSGEEKTKRGVEDITTFVEVANIIQKVKNAKSINYSTNEYEKQLRDRALLSVLAMMGCRISELLSVTHGQLNFHRYRDFIVVEDVKILKRRKEPIRKNFPLPKTGVLKPLTDIFQRYLRSRKWRPEDRLFDLGRHRAWEIVKAMTGKWCHYFRSQRISYLINEKSIRSVAVAKMLGIKKVETIAHYDKSEWEDYRERLGK